MTLFLYNFPISLCIRIWDYFISEGVFALITLIPPILTIFENDFCQYESIEIMEFF